MYVGIQCTTVWPRCCWHSVHWAFNSHPTGLLRQEAFPLPSIQAILLRAAEGIDVLETETATKCPMWVKQEEWILLLSPIGQVSVLLFSAPAMWVMWLVGNIRGEVCCSKERKGIQSFLHLKRGGGKCWRLKTVYVNMPYWLLKGKGGSASLTLPGWCLKVWEWTTVVTN